MLGSHGIAGQMNSRPAKPSKRQASLAHNANALAYGMDGKEPILFNVRAARTAPIQHTAEHELEGSVINEVSKLLHRHPNVVWAVRQNSGTGKVIGRGGNEISIWFYRWLKMPTEMTLTDFFGFTRKGPFALEAKRRDWHFTGTPREKNQQAFITCIREAGGCGGFVTCAEDALQILKNS